MMYVVLVVVCLIQSVIGQSEFLRGPAKVEKNPKFSSSYIPALMQVIAHNTELMKYVIKPQGPTATTSTTARPTPPHKPGIFAPEKPVGPNSKMNLQDEYVKRQQQPSGPNYFDRYYDLMQTGRAIEDTDYILAEIDNYLGKGFGDVYRLATVVDSDIPIGIEESQVLEFSRNFEDSDSRFRFELLRQKRAPPVKAYVSLLALYDALNKETKKLMLNKFAGYSEEVVKNLIEYSSTTSSYQLKSILSKVVEQNEIKNNDINTKLKQLIKDIDDEHSYITEALKNIPPLVFSA